MPLSVTEYQQRAATTAAYPSQAKTLYPLLGLAGEVGELVEKVQQNLFPEGAPQGWDDATCFVRSIFNRLGDVVAAGKQCEQLKKVIRDQTDSLPEGVLDEVSRRVNSIGAEKRPEIIKEQGDCSWYHFQFATDFLVDMDDVLHANLDKLASRMARGVIKGSGDDR